MKQDPDVRKESDCGIPGTIDIHRHTVSETGQAQETGLAEFGRAIGHKSRVAMLQALMGGKALSASELSWHASNSRWFKKSSKYKVIGRYGKNFFVKFFRNSGIIQFQFHEPGEIGCVNHQIANT